MFRASENLFVKQKVTMGSQQTYQQQTYTALGPTCCQIRGNGSITKYRSYRSIKSLILKNENRDKHSTKKEKQAFQTRRECLLTSKQLQQQIGRSIYGLKENLTFNQRMRTEPNLKENKQSKQLPDQHKEIIITMAHNNRVQKNIKRKQIDLTIANTRMELFTRQEKPLKTRRTAVLANQRPTSAVQHIITTHKSKDFDISILSPKNITRSIRPTLDSKARVDRTTVDAIDQQRLSGWEIIYNQDFSLLQPELQKQKRREKKRRKKGNRLQQKEDEKQKHAS